MGKTQTHEFAWGITSVNEATGSARNPWDPKRIAGGSSGGSAVALAARLIPLALGGDTGGSIRIPAAFCGILGFKPTFGRIDTTGAWPLSPSLDHAGPMARTPQDLGRLFSAMQGSAPRQPKLHVRPRTLEGVRIATCTDLHLTTLDSDVERSFHAALIKLTELGATVENRSFAGAGSILPAFGTIQAIEAARVHRDAGLFPRRTAEYGRDVRARLEWGAGLDADRYVSAAAERERLRAGLGALLSDGAYLVTPVAAGPPVAIAGELDENQTGAQFRSQVLPYTTPYNLVGFPSCAVRCGFDDRGLPVGLQISASPWRDWDVLDVVEVLWDATADVQAQMAVCLNQAEPADTRERARRDRSTRRRSPSEHDAVGGIPDGALQSERRR